jgi:hypothetical protein
VIATQCGIPILHCGGIGLVSIALDVAIWTILVKITLSVGREEREQREKENSDGSQ